MNYTRLENETDEELIYRVCFDKDLIGSWQDVADILNQLLNTEYTESKFRKQFQAFNKMLNSNIKKFSNNNDEYLQEFRDLKKELQKERVKLQTEKLEYNKWLRTEARDEMILEQIINSVKKLSPLDIPNEIKTEITNKDYVLIWSDAHYGTEFEIKDLFGNILNSYSPEIFEERMWILYNKVIEIIDKEQIKSLKIFDCGDFTDGILRVSQLMKLRYGVVDASIKYAEFISNWLNMLSKKVKITFQMTFGNHDQLRMLGEPKGTFEQDNMGKIIREFIRIRLENNPNFKFIENPTGYIYSQVACYTILGIHGEIKNTERAIKDFSQIYNVPIDYLISGHLHHSKTEEIGINSEIINVPSIVGIDDYSMKLRKTSNAGAKLLIFNNIDGLICDYRIKLN